MGVASTGGSFHSSASMPPTSAWVMFSFSTSAPSSSECVSCLADSSPYSSPSTRSSTSMPMSLSSAAMNSSSCCIRSILAPSIRAAVAAKTLRFQ